MTAGSQFALIGCSLDAADLQARLVDWAALLGQATSREETAEGVRYVFAGGALDERRIRELATAEQGCCSFLRFDISRVGDRVEMAVNAPTDRLDALRAIFAA